MRFWLSLFLLIEAAQVLAAAPDIYEVPKLSLVQKRNYTLQDELTFSFTDLPLDPLVKYIALGGAYTHFFSEYTGWEVVNANYAIPLDAGLKKDLLTGFCNPTVNCNFPTLQYYLTSNLVFNPLYTKNLLFNSSIVHSTTSFVAGGGLAGYNIGIYPCVDLGVILRFFLNPTSSLKFDFREFIYLSPNINNNMTVTISYAFNMGSKSEK